jgi:hypothetical protein
MGAFAINIPRNQMAAIIRRLIVHFFVIRKHQIRETCFQFLPPA